MSSPDHSNEPDVTGLLLAWSAGERGAADDLLNVVHGELRRIGAKILAGERPGTLQPTVLVHETYLRLIDQNRVQWCNRAHFFAIAGKLMRRITVDHARRRSALKRGGEWHRISLAGQEPLTPEPSLDILALNQALDNLEELDPMKASIVEMKFYGGLTMREVAEVLHCSKATVERHWELARAWLYRRVS